MEMRTRMAALLTAIVIMSATLLSGCWNLTEIDQLAVVAGVAIDKGQNDRLRITVETVEVDLQRIRTKAKNTDHGR